MARSKRAKRPTPDPEGVVSESNVGFRKDLAAFAKIVDPERDYISSLPPEVLDSILFYCMMDHDPEQGLRARAKTPMSERPAHVFISLSAMSKLFRNCVESLSQRQVRKHEGSNNLTNDLQRRPLAVTQQEPVRRSPRLAGATATASGETRVYRIDFVRVLRCYCIVCGKYSSDAATMSNFVGCHAKCESRIFGNTLTLSDAMRQYDLRDYMLIASRKPGPRAKHTDLPFVRHASIYKSRGYPFGWGLSWRVLQKDVEHIARLVHGNVQVHMEEKRKTLGDRKNNRLRKVHLDLKIRHHTDALAKAKSNEQRVFHETLLAKFEDPDWSGNWESDIRRQSDYGDYEDVHDRICKVERCLNCRAATQRKARRRWYYDGWW